MALVLEVAGLEVMTEIIACVQVGVYCWLNLTGGYGRGIILQKLTVVACSWLSFVWHS